MRKDATVMSTTAWHRGNNHMNLRDRLTAALGSSMRADSAIEAIRAHIATDMEVPTIVSRYTNVAEAAGETSAKHVRRVVGNWFHEVAK